jgi:hypothetical protein
MKKIFPLLFAAAIVFLFAACTATDTNAPSLPVGDTKREVLNIYYDGQSLKESGYMYSDIQGIMAAKKIDGNYYYGASLSEITGEDLSSVKGAFLEATDGYVSYICNIEDLFLAAYILEKEEYQSVVLNGKHVYGGVIAGGNLNKGIINIYLVSTPADFTVEIQKNGVKIGELTVNDFMKKTPVEGNKVPTGMFDGSFMYEGGAATHEGRFLGISYETMLAKLVGLNIDLSGNISDVEYYGTNGLGVEGKNEEYSAIEGDSKYFGSIDFFCMFDGMTRNDITTGCPLGLTAFINGSGGRWMTYNLNAINFVIE